MKNKYHFLKLLFIALTFVMYSCDDEAVERIFEASFETSELGLASINESAQINVNFSIPTIEETIVNIDLTESGVTHGTDYSTDLPMVDGTISIIVPSGSQGASFTVTRTTEFINSGNSISLNLSSITGEEEVQLVGNTSLSILFDEVISSGGTVDLETGGSNMPNQCYIDLSKFSQTAVQRDTWELAFHTGTENRVFLNASLLVSAVELEEFSDIDAVNTQSSFTSPLTLSSFGAPVTVNNVSDLLVGLPLGYSMYGPFTDVKEGNLDQTAIEEISANDEENKVYILSLGNEIPDEKNMEGGLSITGDHRGFYKVRILMNGDDYLLQYAELDATTHTEVTISKNSGYNHTFYSLSSGSEIAVEPAATDWDINFSGVFSYYGFDFGFGAGLTYSDYGLHNTLGGTELYQVTIYSTDETGTVTNYDVPSYDDFTISDVTASSLVNDNRAVIGSDWRDSAAGIAKDDRYFVIKDSEDNYFKLQFTRLLSEQGERGYVQFIYELL